MDKEGVNGTSLATKSVTFRLSGTADDIRRILDAAAEGKFDRIPVESPVGTIMLRVDEISVAPAGSQESAHQRWTRRTDKGASASDNPARE
jgi:hypothetical protein